MGAPVPASPSHPLWERFCLLSLPCSKLHPEGPEIGPSPARVRSQACPVQRNHCSQHDGTPVARLAGEGTSISYLGEPARPHPSLAQLPAGAV